MTSTLSLIEGKYALAVNVAGLGLGTVDYVANTITLDARAGEIFGLPAGVPLDRDVLHDAIHPEDRPVIDHQVEALLHPDYDNVIDVEHRVLKSDGDIRWVSARKKVEFLQLEANGPEIPVSGLVAIMDITNQKRSQEQVEYLLEELNHRSKNMLTIVEVLARRTLTSGPVDTFQERFSNRIAGLVRNSDAMVHSTLDRIDLRELAKSHLAAFIDVSSGRVVFEGPDLNLKPAEVQAIGMALHELSTNAVKYGALSNDAGRVQLNWYEAPDDAEMIEVCWRETDGPPVSPPESGGFGQTVMTVMAAGAVDGTAEIEYPPEGLVWRLRLPKSRVT